MKFRVNPTQLNNSASSLLSLATDTAIICQSLENVLAQVTSSGPETQLNLTGTAISDVLTELRTAQQTLSTMSASLYSISDAYISVESSLSGNVSTRTIALRSQVVNNSSQDSTDSSLAEKYKSSFGKHFWDDFRNAVIEGAGNTIVKVSGLVNVATAMARSTGQNAFVVLNPKVAQSTLKWAKSGQRIVTGAKYGLPVIGGIFDYISLKKSGTSTVDALIKSTAHVGISAVGAKAGFAIGSIIGSVIPGAGTVAGAAIGTAAGFVLGVGISTISEMVFDSIYDNVAAEVIDNIINPKANISSNSLGCVFG